MTQVRDIVHIFLAIIISCVVILMTACLAPVFAVCNLIGTNTGNKFCSYLIARLVDACDILDDMVHEAFSLMENDD